MGSVIQDGKVNFYVEVNNGVINFNSKKEIQQQLTTIPQVQLDEVVGREFFLEKLDDILNREERIVNVHGIAGTGKSTVIKTFIRKNRERYNHIAWIDIKAAVKEDIVFNPQLVDNLFLGSEKKMNEEGDLVNNLFEIIINRLRELKGCNCLVIDNCNEEIEDAHLRDMLKLNTNWHVITCSRNLLEGFANVELKELSAEDASRLFALHYKREWDKNIVSAILELLEFHTLTIEIIAKNAQAARTPLADIYNRIKKKGVTVLKRSDIKIPHSYNTKLHNILYYLVDTLRTYTLDEHEQRFLLQFSILPSTAISFEGEISLYTLFTIKNEKEREALSIGLNNLADRGWIGWDRKNDNFRMHKLVQDIIRFEFKPTFAKCSRILYGTAKLIDFKKDKNPATLIAYAPYAESALRAVVEPRIEISNVANTLAEIYRHSGEHTKAILFHKYSLAILKKIENALPRELSMAYNNLAAAYQYFGLYGKDIAYFKYPENNLAEAVDRFRSRHLDRSISYFETAIRIDPSMEDMRRAQILINIAESFRGKKEFGKAYSCLQEAMKIHEVDPGDSIQLVILYQNLSVLSEDMGDIGNAVFYATSGLTVLKNVFPKRKFEIGVALSNLASIYYTLSGKMQDIDILKQAKLLSDEALENLGSIVPVSNATFQMADNMNVYIRLTLEGLEERG